MSKPITEATRQKLSLSARTQGRNEFGQFARGRVPLDFYRIPIEERPFLEPGRIGVPGKRWLIRGTARPASNSNARTPDLRTDFFYESDEYEANIDRQEELLHEKYENWVFFDTYVEEVE